MSKNNKLSLKNKQKYKQFTFRKLNTPHPTEPTGSGADTPLWKNTLLENQKAQGPLISTNRYSVAVIKDLTSTHKTRQAGPPNLGVDQAMASLPLNRLATPPLVDQTPTHTQSFCLIGARVNLLVGIKPDTPLECVEDSTSSLVTLPNPSLGHPLCNSCQIFWRTRFLSSSSRALHDRCQF